MDVCLHRSVNELVHFFTQLFGGGILPFGDGQLGAPHRLGGRGRCDGAPSAPTAAQAAPLSRLSPIVGTDGSGLVPVGPKRSLSQIVVLKMCETYVDRHNRC